MQSPCRITATYLGGNPYLKDKKIKGVLELQKEKLIFREGKIVHFEYPIEKITSLELTLPKFLFGEKKLKIGVKKYGIYDDHYVVFESATSSLRHIHDCIITTKKNLENLFIEEAFELHGKLESGVQDLDKRISDLIASLDSLEIDVNKGRGSLEEVTEKIEDLRGNLEEVNEELLNLERSLMSSMERVGDVSEIPARREEVISLLSRDKELLRSLKDKLVGLSDRLSELSKRVLEVYSDKRTFYKTRIDYLNERVSSVENQINEIKRELNKGGLSISDLRELEDRLNELTDSLKKDFDELKELLSREKENELLDEINNYVNELRLEQKKSEIMKELDSVMNDVRGELEKRRSREEILEKFERDLISWEKEIEKIIQEANKFGNDPKELQYARSLYNRCRTIKNFLDNTKRELFRYKDILTSEDLDKLNNTISKLQDKISKSIEDLKKVIARLDKLDTSYLTDIETVIRKLQKLYSTLRPSLQYKSISNYMREKGKGYFDMLVVGGTTIIRRLGISLPILSSLHGSDVLAVFVDSDHELFGSIGSILNMKLDGKPVYGREKSYGAEYYRWMGVDNLHLIPIGVSKAGVGGRLEFVPSTFEFRIFNSKISKIVGDYPFRVPFKYGKKISHVIVANGGTSKGLMTALLQLNPRYIESTSFGEALGSFRTRIIFYVGDKNNYRDKVALWDVPIIVGLFRNSHISSLKYTILDLILRELVDEELMILLPTIVILDNLIKEGYLNDLYSGILDELKRDVPDYLRGLRELAIDDFGIVSFLNGKILYEKFNRLQESIENKAQTEIYGLLTEEIEDLLDTIKHSLSTEVPIKMIDVYMVVPEINDALVDAISSIENYLSREYISQGSGVNEPMRFFVFPLTGVDENKPEIIPIIAVRAYPDQDKVIEALLDWAGVTFDGEPERFLDYLERLEREFSKSRGVNLDKRFVDSILRVFEEMRELAKSFMKGKAKVPKGKPDQG